MRVEEIVGPAYWASALINGDYSGLDEQEAAWCRAWQEKIEPFYIVGTTDEEPYFTWSYDVHAYGCCMPQVRGGEVLTYIAHAR